MGEIPSKGEAGLLPVPTPVPPAVKAVKPKNPDAERVTRKITLPSKFTHLAVGS